MNDRKAHKMILDIIEAHGGENKKLLKEYLEEGIFKDELTGLWNRRYMDLILPIEFEMSCNRRDEPASFVFLDMAALNEINNKQGYDMGDKALKTIAAVIKGGELNGQKIKGMVRKTDIAGRYGDKSDEFGILLKQTDLRSSWKNANSIKEAIGNHNLYVRGGVANSEVVGIPLLYSQRGRDMIKKFEDNYGDLKEVKDDIITHLTSLKKEGKKVFTRKQIGVMLKNLYDFSKIRDPGYNVDADFTNIAPEIIKKYADMGLQLAKEKNEKTIYAHGGDGFGTYTDQGVWVPFRQKTSNQ